MALRFDPTISLGSVLSSVVMIGSGTIVWGQLQATLAVHTTEIRQLQDTNSRHETDRTQDKSEIKEMINDVKVEIKEVKTAIANRVR